MVLNNAFFQKPEGGGKNYFWESEIDLRRDAKGRSPAPPSRPTARRSSTN